jgi:branched-chain amino acid transport system permease protein
MKIVERSKPLTSWLLLAAIIAILPVIIKSPYFISMMVFVALYGVLAIGAGILMGQAGMFSLVQPTWFGLGAYGAGILAVRGVPPWIGILVAAISVMILAYAIGIPVLRLRGLYLACATFGILIVVQECFIQLGDITGGHSGLLGVPRLSFAGMTLRNDLHYYLLSWALCIGCLWFCSNMIHSRIGRAVKASRDSEVASKSLGINIPKHRLQIFVLTAFMSSLAGSVFCFYLRFAAPSCFGFSLIIELMLMMVIGGIESVWGLLLGSFVITWLDALLSQYLSGVLPVMTNEVSSVIFGIAIIFVLIFMPRGLVGWINQLLPFGRKAYEFFRS